MTTIDTERHTLDTLPVMAVTNESLHPSGACVREVQVSDPYIVSVEELQNMTEDIARLENMATKFPAEADLTSVFYDLEAKPALCQWYGFMGKGIALYNLQRPDITTLGDGLANPYAAAAEIDPLHYDHRIAQFDSYGDTVVDDESRRLFLYAADGRGIRNRAQVFKEVVAEKAAQNTGNQFDMLSVACGAALPAYEAAEEVIRQGGEPKLSLIDIDLAALNYAHQLAERQGLSEAVDIRQMDLVNVFTGVIDLGKELSDTESPKQFDTIDLLGIFEYFDADTAVVILQKMKQVIKPGGSIVFGNMLTTRPQMEFFKRYVGWKPSVEPRTIEDMLDIIVRAGYDPKEVTLSIPQDGVYAVVEIANINQ